NLWRTSGFGAGVHLRRIHYRLVSQEQPVLMLGGTPYSNTDQCWNALICASRDARYLRLVHPKSFVDQRNAAPMVAIVSEADAEINLLDGYDFSPERSEWLSFIPATLELKRPVVRQRYMIEVWVEKSTLSDILHPFHFTHRVNIITGVG